MTLRKFFRFFKHFGYYMRKDWNWLKKKIRERKAEKKAKKASENMDRELKKFRQILNKISNKRQSKSYIFLRNAYYIVDSKRQHVWTKIWHEDDIWFFKDEYGTKQVKFKSFAGNKRNRGVTELKSVFSENTDRANYITVLLGDLTSIQVLDDSKDDLKCYRIYHLYGKQRPRLEYVVEWDAANDSEIYVTSSRAFCRYNVILSYPASLLMDPLMARNSKK